MVSDRLRVPAALPSLGLGMLVGSDGLGPDRRRRRRPGQESQHRGPGVHPVRRRVDHQAVGFARGRTAQLLAFQGGCRDHGAVTALGVELVIGLGWQTYLLVGASSPRPTPRLCSTSSAGPHFPGVKPGSWRSSRAPTTRSPSCSPSESSPPWIAPRRRSRLVLVRGQTALRRPVGRGRRRASRPLDTQAPASVGRSPFDRRPPARRAVLRDAGSDLRLRPFGDLRDRPDHRSGGARHRRSILRFHAGLANGADIGWASSFSRRSCLRSSVGGSRGSRIARSVRDHWLRLRRGASSRRQANQPMATAISARTAICRSSTGSPAASQFSPSR